jgi:DNA polymerase-3 subunit epsilon
MRQVVLDTETTGLEPEAGHRIIEIGCVELVNRRLTQQSFHRYVNPGRAVDLGALEVHGIGDEFLATQPPFQDIAEEFLDFVSGAELVIHNAGFDVAFINGELGRLELTTGDIAQCCEILDSLALARRLHPGQRNSLDALAKRYQVDNSKRELHGALLDAQILAEVYLAMTGGQASLSLDGDGDRVRTQALKAEPVDRDGLRLVVPGASAEELAAHQAMLEALAAEREAPTLWEKVDSEGSQ